MVGIAWERNEAVYDAADDGLDDPGVRVGEGGEPDEFADFVGGFGEVGEVGEGGSVRGNGKRGGRHYVEMSWCSE